MSAHAIRFSPTERATPTHGLGYDVWLLVAVLILTALGLVMVASASISIANQAELPSLYFFYRQLIALGIGCAVGTVVLFVPLRNLEAASTTMLFLAVASLAAVIIPGLGHDANGATRWLRIGPASLQPSEPAKLQSGTFEPT